MIRSIDPFSLFQALSLLQYGFSSFEALEARSTTDRRVALLRVQVQAAQLNQTGCHLTLPESPQEPFDTLEAYVSSVLACVTCSQALDVTTSAHYAVWS